MKKFFTAIILSAALWSSESSAQLFSQPSTVRDQLKGPVASIKEYNLLPKEYFTDEEQKKYKKSGQPLPQYDTIPVMEKTFGTDGFVTEETNHTFSPARINRYSYKDARIRGLLERQETYSGDKLTRTYVLQYDSHGEISSGEARDEDGNLIFSEKYEIRYDRDSVFMTGTHMSARTGAIELYDVCYRLKPTRSMARMKLSNDRRTQSFRFDKSELPVEIFFDGGRTKEYVILPADMTQEVIHYNFTPEGQRYVAQRTTRDSEGNDVKRTLYTPSGEEKETVTISYEYDTHGNWVRKEVSRPTGKEITLRRIDYHRR